MSAVEKPPSSTLQQPATYRRCGAVLHLRRPWVVNYANWNALLAPDCPADPSAPVSPEDEGLEVIGRQADTPQTCIVALEHVMLLPRYILGCSLLLFHVTPCQSATLPNTRTHRPFDIFCCIYAHNAADAANELCLTLSASRPAQCTSCTSQDIV